MRNPHRAATGLAKRGYTKHEAKHHAAILATRNGIRLAVYRCPECGQWHLGRRAHG